MSVDGTAPLARRTSLLARMRMVAASVPGTDPARRVQLTLAMDRFLARLLATTEWGSWVLKGGYANQLREPAEARFTQDIDLRLDEATDRRAEHPWPPEIPRAPASWGRPYAALRKEMGIAPETPDAARDTLARFLEPVLAGARDLRSKKGGTWAATRPG